MDTSRTQDFPSQLWHAAALLACCPLFCVSLAHAQLTNITAVLNSPSSPYQVSLSWTDSNSPQASNYLVQAALDSAFSHIAASGLLPAGQICGQSSNPANYCLEQILGLPPSTPYYFRVNGQAAASLTTPGPVGTIAGVMGNWTPLRLTDVNSAATTSGADCGGSSGGNCGISTVFVSSGPNGDGYAIWTQDDVSGSAYNVLAQRINSATGTNSWNTPLTIAASLP